MWARLLRLWRTTTVRLTALFMVVFVVFAVLLLAGIGYQTNIELQRGQTEAIDREAAALATLDRDSGFRATIMAVERLSRQPGPGIYFLADPAGQAIMGNLPDVPAAVLASPGTYSFNYDRVSPDPESRPGEQGNALVRSTRLDSGFLLVVGRDVVERRGFTALVLQWFAIGVLGILVFSGVAGGIAALRVLRRIDAIGTTARTIMAGNLSERIPVTARNDEFDALATRLNLMLDRIEQLLQGLKEVTDNVAHDLRTPLTRLRNKVEAALRDGVNEQSRRDALETTLFEADQLIKTFNALLMIARAEAGTPSAAFTDIDLSAAVADVAELYGPLAEDEGLVLEAAIEPGIRLKASRELLGQALVNLIENAVKYGVPPAGGPGHIAVGLSRIEGKIRISVADNGAGIPPDDRPRVVERFVRLEKSRTEPGSGLGLSLVNAVARLHGGALVLSDNGPGLRAEILLEG
jgi:signal transduction histidine kinase